MRRIAAIIGLVGVGALVVLGPAASDDGGTYEVRAIFDNGNFLVNGEPVRVAGVGVGTVSSVDVTMPGDWANRSCLSDSSSSACSAPGKAAVVMKITDPGFQDFRRDASCLIRPGSLLGEKYVDCRPTQSRAAGSQPPPPLAEIPEGESGAGQRFLPLENNGQSVDLDLVNNIMREPYAERFRLILNSLGAGLAARGKTLDAIIRRANPALRQTDRVLAILARQNRQLAQLARDGDTVLEPLARERRHLAGFINNSNIAAEATAERSQELEAGLERFPGALRELRSTMVELKRFSDQATPLFADFGAGAPAIARATRALGPFAKASRPALITLGTASAESQQPLVNSDPMLRKVRDLSQKAAPGAKSLGRLLTSLRQTGGYKKLMDFLFYTTGGINGYDQYGHFLRAMLKITNCTFVTAFPVLGCGSNWAAAAGNAKRNAPITLKEAKAAAAKAGLTSGGPPARPPTGAGAADPGAGSTTAPGQPLDAQGEPPAGTTMTTPAAPPPGNTLPSQGTARDLLDTVIGKPEPRHRGGVR
jgi:phospholipid/cholesterol/gamma-HCH transport system substrate-binding protein